MDLIDEVKRLWQPEEFILHGLTATYIRLLVEDILKESEIQKCLQDRPLTNIQALKELGFKPYSLPALNWLLNYANENSTFSRNKGMSPTSFTQWTKTGIKDFIEKEDTNLLTYLEYLDKIAEDYPAFFKGEKSGNEIVFANERMKYWQFYFGNEFRTYRIVNRFFAIYAAEHVMKTKSGTLLELGAGTGGATVALLERLLEKEAFDSLEKYTYTDFASGFLKNADKIFPEKASPIKYQAIPIDINHALAEQGVPKQSQDFIFSANCVHVAKELVPTLKDLHDTLKPGGALLLCEGLRPEGMKSLPEEIIFSLLSSYTDVRLDSTRRPNPGFLSKNQWKSCLSMAGFRDINIVADVDFVELDDVKEGIGVVIAKK